MADVTVRVSSENWILVLVVAGHFSYDGDREQFIDMVKAMKDAESQFIVADMSQAEFEDYDPLSLLMIAQSELREVGKAMIIVSGPHLDARLRVAKFDIGLRTVAKRKDAVLLAYNLGIFIEGLKFRQACWSCHSGTQKCPLHTDCHPGGGNGRPKNPMVCYMKMALYYFDEKMKGGTPGPP